MSGVLNFDLLLVAAVLLLALPVRAWIDRRQDEGAWPTLAFAGFAAGMSGIPWLMVEKRPERRSSSESITSAA